MLFLVVVALEIPSCHLVARFGPRRALAAMLLVWAAGTALTAASTGTLSFALWPRARQHRPGRFPPRRDHAPRHRRAPRRAHAGARLAASRRAAGRLAHARASPALSSSSASRSTAGRSPTALSPASPGSAMGFPAPAPPRRGPAALAHRSWPGSPYCCASLAVLILARLSDRPGPGRACPRPGSDASSVLLDRRVLLMALINVAFGLSAYAASALGASSWSPARD